MTSSENTKYLSKSRRWWIIHEALSHLQLCGTGNRISMTEKIKIYLDTNMVLDLFINHAKALKRKEDVLLPKKYEFLLANKKKIEFVTSFLTKAEIVRELVSGFGIEYEPIESLWNDFLGSLNCKIVETFTFDNKIADFVSHSQMKLRTLFNFMHIFIALDQGCYFVSGDNIEFRKLAGTWSNFIWGKQKSGQL